ncbi:hypothetical protein CO652_03080 [Rhizobium sp. H4]|nr:hypothetical protein CO652_03080 [Rhizobium sp. H4]
MHAQQGLRLTVACHGSSHLSSIGVSLALEASEQRPPLDPHCCVCHRIQPRRVRAVNNSLERTESLASNDLGALDPCDEHRDEGGRRGVLTPLPASSALHTPTSSHAARGG